MPSLFRSLPLRSLPILVLAIVLAGASASVWAQQDRGRRGQQPPPPPEQNAQRQRDDEALSDAVRRIERANRGQVLSAERMQSDGREVNRIKIVDDRGRVRVYMEDPKRGRDDDRSRDEDQREPPTRDRDD